ncbi:MAG: T9SS type A sorting domain-containing protein, partial [Bacteroidota bacterium]
DSSAVDSCNGQATVLVSGGTSPYFYQWDDNSSQTTATADSLCAGTYHITITDANGCTAIDSVNISEVSGIENFNNVEYLKIYPNPSGNTITIQFPNPKNEKHTLTIYNSKGQLVQKIENITSGELKVKNNNWESGLYFFQLQNNIEIVGTGKFIRE